MCPTNKFFKNILNLKTQKNNAFVETEFQLQIREKNRE